MIDERIELTQLDCVWIAWENEQKVGSNNHSFLVAIARVWYVWIVIPRMMWWLFVGRF